MCQSSVAARFGGGEMRPSASFFVVAMTFCYRIWCILAPYIFAAVIVDRCLIDATLAITYEPGADALKWYSGAERNHSEVHVTWVDDTWHHNYENSEVSRIDNHPPRNKSRRETDEERLTSILFRNYASSLRPVYNSSQSVEVQFGLNLIQIGNMDEVNQVLEISVWMEMSWVEERLQWNPDDFSGLKVIRMPTKFIWVPDIVLYNSADDLDRRTKAEEVRAMIAYNGEIFLGPYVKLRSTCILDLTLYPYDEQSCSLIFGSWTYDSSQLFLVAKADNVELSQYVESAKWQLLGTGIRHDKRRHSCCRAPFSDVIVMIKMRRRFLYNNLFNIFIPTIWLSLLCLLCFYLAPETGEKVTLGITVLLTFTLFTWMIAENTPRTSDFVPLISIYLTITMSLSALVVGLQVFMLNIHGLTPVLRPVPNWLRIVAIDGIARFMRIENVHKELKERDRRRQHRYFSSCYWGDPRNRPGTRESKIRRLKKRLLALVKRGENYRPHDDGIAMQNFPPGEQFNDDIVDEQFDTLMQELTSSSRLRFMARESRFFEDIERIIIGENEEPYFEHIEGPISELGTLRRLRADPTTDPSEISRTERDILVKLIHSVNYMAKKERQDALTAQIATEWRLIAVVFDRLAFLFFFTFTIGVTFFLLVLAPLTQSEVPKPHQIAAMQQAAAAAARENQST